MRITTKLLLTLFLAAAGLFAQGERGALTGVVKDPSGAVVVGAKIALVDLATNVSNTTTTTDAGIYRVPYLTPGQYKVTASFAGFKQAVLSPVMVAVATTTTADFTLEVGAATESVTVSAEANTVVLKAEDAELGRTISQQEYHSWPTVSMDGERQVQILFFKSLPGTVGDEWQGTINGGQYYSHDILVEGMSVGQGYSSFKTPSSEAISEFNLQSGTLGAQYGATQTAVANFNIKSGTNQFHGSLYESLQNNKLNANTYAGNATGSPLRFDILNNYGGTIGGPVIVPKVYNGRNKTFFFFNSEFFKERRNQVKSPVELPSADFKQGNFSRLLNPAFTGDPRSGTTVGTDALGRPVIFGAIYNPSTTRTVNGQQVRDPFQGNIIPQGSWSKVSGNILTMAPLPDPTNDIFLRNTRTTTAFPTKDVNVWAGKINHNINDMHRLSFVTTLQGYSRLSNYSSAYLPFPGTASSTWTSSDLTGSIVHLSEDWIVSPHIVNHFGIGFSRWLNGAASTSMGQNWPAKIGLTGVGPATFPQISFTASSPTLGSQVVTMGNNADGYFVTENKALADDLTWIKGGHTFKFGLEIRRLGQNTRALDGSSGSFTFADNQTAAPGFIGSTGFSFASFLLGTGYSASVPLIGANVGYRRWYPAMYFADTWKVTPRLTLNYGLRWEVASGLTEVGNRMSAFDPTKPNPGADGYPGALVFLSDTGRHSFQNTYWGGVGPRLAIAYRATDKIVLRGGYGMNYSQPPTGLQSGSATWGYNGSNDIAASALNPAYQWDQGYRPYSGGALPNKDPAQLNGQTIPLIRADSNRLPLVQNYNLSLQWLLRADTVLEAAYIGNKGSRLLNSNMAVLNSLDPKYLSLGDTLLDDISLHPEIHKPYPSFTGSVAQALRPFPQFQSVVDAFPNFGISSYNAFQFTLTRRVASGLSVLGTYVFGKTLTDSSDPGGATSVPNLYDRKTARALASFDHPHDIKITWVYDLPFGKGQKFLNHGGIVNAVLGGWMLTGIHQYRSGEPISLYTDISTGTTLFNGYNGILPISVPGVNQFIGQSGLDIFNGTPWLNPAAFTVPRTTSRGVPLSLGNVSPVLPRVRGPWYFNEDFGISKKFQIGEKVTFSLRGDAFKALNRVQRGYLDTDVNSSTFGRLFGTRDNFAAEEGPRVIQLEGRIIF